jgi:hypothetical protein
MHQNFNYAKFCGRIREKFGSFEEFAQAAGFSSTELTAKLNNLADFTLPEMDKACGFLGIQSKEITEFFFTEN